MHLPLHERKNTIKHKSICETGRAVGALIHYALVPIVNGDKGVMN